MNCNNNNNKNNEILIEKIKILHLLIDINVFFISFNKTIIIVCTTKTTTTTIIAKIATTSTAIIIIIMTSNNSSKNYKVDIQYNVNDINAMVITATIQIKTSNKITS